MSGMFRLLSGDGKLDLSGSDGYLPADNGAGMFLRRSLKHLCGTACGGRVIQPNMKMVGKEEQCPFLNEKGRCNIHAIRPGICRLFPLGRCYDGEGGFQYFLQIYECKKEPKSKVKIKNWLGVEEIGRYERFVAQWHYFQKDAQKVLAGISQEALVKKIHLYLLAQFYQKPYQAGRDFYEQFEERLREAKQQIGIAG